MRFLRMIQSLISRWSVCIKTWGPLGSSSDNLVTFLPLIFQVYPHHTHTLSYKNTFVYYTKIISFRSILFPAAAFATATVSAISTPETGFTTSVTNRDVPPGAVLGIVTFSHQENVKKLNRA